MPTPMRTYVRLFFMLGLVGTVAWQLHHWRQVDLQRQVDQLAIQRSQLQQYLRQLQSSRKVAQINVLERYTNTSNQTVGRLRWQEVNDEGVLQAPQIIDIIGELMYVEAQVVKFKFPEVVAEQPEHRSSIVQFRRVFGDGQAPCSAVMLDPVEADVGRYTDQDKLSESVSRSLTVAGDIWPLFWRMITHPELADEFDIRVVQIEAPAVPINAGDGWQVTLESAGGINLKKIAEENLLARR